MSSDQVFMGVLQFSVLLFSLVFHEFGHAWMALRCGDTTARDLGRVTLNPLAHIDPIGTVMFPLLQIFAGVPLIGWAKPVPFNRAALRNPRRDDMLIASAGPGFNLMLALVGAVAWRLSEAVLAGADTGVSATLYQFGHRVLPVFVQINVLLALFNMIPMPPLDGSYIVANLLPTPLSLRFQEFGARWGFVVVLGLVYTGVARRFINFGAGLLSPVLQTIAGT
jgi:Zn-dependent protease